MAKKKKKKGTRKAGATLPKDRVELHLPQELFDRVKLMKPEDVGEILRILFDCNAPGANIFGVTDVDIYLAQEHDASAEQLTFAPTKVCNGP